MPDRYRKFAKLSIEASGQAFVMIDIFDNAEIEVTAMEGAKIVVNEIRR
jgi:hypothetical protein